MSIIGTLHSDLVFGRRVNVLAKWFETIVPKNARVLDVGCGDGAIAALLQSKRPDITISGVDVLARSQTHIPVEMFDGTNIPYKDSSFSVVMFSDVLHHTTDPNVILKEAHRVSSEYVLIKDHYRQGMIAGSRLRFMDWVGNARYGVSLPYNYWNPVQWETSWESIGLQQEKLCTNLDLYPKPADWIFGAQLHFIALLKKCNPARH
ncbi:MAG TPA: class I SAM-dependent methyltransferase [Bryobacteraceae bacterium]|nr:class I SAM-dependent methyltransferase [Bryobacteraceae bacterium]